LGLSFATEEQRGVFELECLQPWIGTLIVGNGVLRTGSGLFAKDRTLEPVQGIGFVQRLMKLDPSMFHQESRQPRTLFTLSAWQQNRDDAKRSIFDASINGDPHLFVLPRSHAAGADEDAAGRGLFERFFGRGLPRFASDQMPSIEPTVNSLALKPVGKVFDGGFVVAVVR